MFEAYLGQQPKRKDWIMRDMYHFADTLAHAARIAPNRAGFWMPDYPFRDLPARGWPYWDVPADLPDYELPQEPSWFPDF